MQLIFNDASSIPVQKVTLEDFPPSALIGQYFEIVTE